jgi:hypothetical protein
MVDRNGHSIPPLDGFVWGKLRIRLKQATGDAVEISAWLRSLGLAQYEAIFQENAIDAERLPELTEADL